MWVPIVVIGGLVLLYIGTYALNKKTKKSINKKDE